VPRGRVVLADLARVAVSMAMAIYTLARFETRSPDAEPAMHELAARVRRELPRSSWTVYRDTAAPQRFLAVARDEDDRSRELSAAAFAAVVGPLIDELDVAQYALVTSSDLARRRR